MTNEGDPAISDHVKRLVRDALFAEYTARNEWMNANELRPVEVRKDDAYFLGFYGRPFEPKKPALFSGDADQDK